MFSQLKPVEEKLVGKMHHAPPPPHVQDPHSESEIDAKIQQQLVFKFYISELSKTIYNFVIYVQELS